MEYIESTNMSKLIAITEQNEENLLFLKNWLEQRGYEPFKTYRETILYSIPEKEIADFRSAYKSYRRIDNEEMHKLWSKMTKQLTDDYQEVTDTIDDIKKKMDAAESTLCCNEYDKILQYYLGMSKILTKYIIMC